MQSKKSFLINRAKKNLILGISKRSGRNFFGRKTIFTQSGGLFKKLRVLDYNRIINSFGILLTIEKDINRTGFVGLVCYENGFHSYILLPDDYNEIGMFTTGFVNEFLYNASTFLFNVPNGNFIHHIEVLPGKGAKLSRAAGTSSFIISSDRYFSFLKMSSG